MILLKKKKRNARGMYSGPNVDLSGKVVVITGGNCGIGFETAKGIAQRKASVILACRNVKEGNEAATKLKAITNNTHIECLHLDLSSMSSVRSFAREFKQSGMGCHALILNAAKGFGVKKEITDEGYESIFATNHLGHFLLVNELMDVLNANSTRIISVSSSLHRRGVIDFDDLMRDKQPYDGRQSYNNSKLANVLFTYELQRILDKLQHPHATAICCHPGIAVTRLARDSNARSRWIFHSIIVPLIGKTAWEAAQTSIHCAISPDSDSMGGKYFGNCEEEKSCESSYNEETAQKLWSVSEQLTQTHFST